MPDDSDVQYLDALGKQTATHSLAHVLLNGLPGRRPGRPSSGDGDFRKGSHSCSRDDNVSGPVMLYKLGSKAPIGLRSQDGRLIRRMWNVDAFAEQAARRRQWLRRLADGLRPPARILAVKTDDHADDAASH